MRKNLKSFLPKLLSTFIIFNILISQSLPIIELFASKAYAASEYIITDNNASYSTATPDGWTLVNNRGYNNDTIHNANWTGGVGDNATWNVSSLGGITTNWYTVYVSWVTNSNRSKIAQYTVNGLTSNTILVNQTLLNDQVTPGTNGQWSGWYSLGIYNLNDASNVVLTKTDDGYVSADEVRLVLDETAPITPSNVEVITDTGVEEKVYDNGTTKDNTPRLVWSDESDSGSPVVYNYMANGTQYGTNLVNNYIQAGATPNGTYLWQAQACDLAGNCSDWSTAWSLTVDTVAPVTTLTSPLTDSSWTNEISFEGNSTDTFGIDYVNIFIRDSITGCTSPDDSCNTNIWTNFNTIDANAETVLNFETTFSFIEDGKYDFKVSAIDIAGNIEQSEYAYNVSLTSIPSQPTWGTIYKGHEIDPLNEIGCGGYTNTTQITLEWNQNPEADIAGYWFGTRINPRHQWFDYPNTVKTANMTIGNEPYIYTIIAVDNVGNESVISDFCNLTLDLINPIVTVDLSPTTDNTPTIVGTITETNLDTLTVNVDGTDYVATVAGTDYSADISANLSDGDHSVTVTAVDLAGNTTVISGTLTVDATPPYVFAGLDRITNSADEIDDASYDASVAGLDYFTWTSSSVNGVVKDWDSSTDDYVPTFSAVMDGTYTLTFEVTDTLGQTNSDTVDVIWDTTPPVTTITSHLDGDYINGTVNLVGNIDELNMMRYYYRIRNVDTNQIITSRTVYDTLENEIFYTWNTTAVVDGVYEIHLAARDLAGNRELVSEDSILVTVDNTAPVVHITNPSDGAILRGTIDIEGNIEEENPGHYNLSLYRDLDGTCNIANTWNFSNRVWQTTVNNSNTVDHLLDTTTFEDGNYMIRLAARDSAGNRDPMSNSGTGVSVEVICVTFDNTPPYTYFVTDYSNGYYNEDIFIEGVSEDNSGIDIVYIYIKESSSTDWPTDPIFTFDYGESPTMLEWDTWWGPEFNGVYDIKAYAVDTVGNIENTAYMTNITFDYTIPTIDTTEDMVLDEGQMLNLSFLDDKAMRDNIALDKVYLTFNYTGTIGGNIINENLLENEEIDVSMAGCGYDGCGLGGTLNELVDYETGEYITFGDYEFPIDTSLLQEGTYTFNYYVTDMAGNRSDCDLETEGDQNCEFSITVNNVAPQVTFSGDQTISEGDVATFTASFTDPSTVSMFEYLYELGLLDSILADMEMTMEEVIEEVELMIALGEMDPIMKDLLYSILYGDDSAWTATVSYLDNDEYLYSGQLPTAGEVNLGQFTSPGSITVPNMMYTHAGTYTVTLKVCEATNEMNFFSENECTTKTVTVTVNNVAPTVSITADPAINVVEGTPITLTANVFSGNAPYTYLWSGDCSGTSPTYALTEAQYKVAGNYTCKVTVTDIDGDIAESEITVSTSDNLPSVIIYSNQINDNGTVRSTTADILLTSVVLGGNQPYTYQWGGVCSGTGTTTTVSLTPGSYYCRVDITDDDGDKAAAGVTIVINDQGNLVGPGSNEPEESGENGEGEKEGEVLGTEAQRCETKQKVSGYVYNDANNNNQKDDGEETLKNVKVTLTYTYEGKEYSVDTETDENGYWEIELCPGNYKVNINPDDLPEGYVLGEEQEITLKEDNKLTDVNLGLLNNSNDEDKKSKLWWLLLIPAGILVIGGAIATLTKKDKNE